MADNLEASHSEAEARDLSTININFRTTGFREAHISVAVINTAATANPISREINPIPTKDEAAAGVLNKQEDTVMVGPITRVIALFLKRVIRECLSNDFRRHDLQIIIMMLIYSVVFMYFF